MANSNQVWSTGNEIEFISKLGTHGRGKVSRVKCLSGYLVGAAKRNDWGGMDKYKCIIAAKTFLARAKRAQKVK